MKEKDVKISEIPKIKGSKGELVVDKRELNDFIEEINDLQFSVPISRFIKEEQIEEIEGEEQFDIDEETIRLFDKMDVQRVYTEESILIIRSIIYELYRLKMFMDNIDLKIGKPLLVKEQIIFLLLKIHFETAKLHDHIFVHPIRKAGDYRVKKQELVLPRNVVKKVWTQNNRKLLKKLYEIGAKFSFAFNVLENESFYRFRNIEMNYEERKRRMIAYNMFMNYLSRKIIINIEGATKTIIPKDYP
jgi:hypothetical protein